MSANSNFERIRKEELTNYNTFYKATVKSNTRLLDLISNFVHQKKHNPLIPLAILLTARSAGGVNISTYQAAVTFDLLYTATRIHDDVEDESVTGKGFMKLSGLWKEKLSVLMGDYFLAKGLLISVKNKTYNLLEIFSKSVKEITEGEIGILHNSMNLNTSEKDYFEIMEKKSASLFTACALAGAVTAGASETGIKTYSSFGRNMGMAIYISNELDFAKTVTNDRYRITLPLIYALQNSTPEEQSLLKRSLHYPVEEKTTRFISAMIEEKGGIDKASQLMENFRYEAVENITEFPYSEPIENLKQLVYFSV